MDTFMDKLAQKLNAQEMIKANSAADAEEMDQLKSQPKASCGNTTSAWHRCSRSIRN